MPPAKKAATPLPVRPMMGILILNSTPSFQINMIFPFIPWMVEDLRGVQPRGIGIGIGGVLGGGPIGARLNLFHR
jgi:hypothetical protein